MSNTRDYGAELDAITLQLNELKQLVNQLAHPAQSARKPSVATTPIDGERFRSQDNDEMGTIFYSGQYRGTNPVKWSPQHRSVAQLLGQDSDKIAKILAALGNKQRLDILTTVMHEPLTGPEIVERLNMGTTGQLYHHTKALLGADLLVQEDRGGKYSLPIHRSLPLLLLLAAASDLLDTSDYMELAEARNHADDYLKTSQHDYDPHHLLWSLIENSILEHQAGYCTEINIIMHSERCITVADNGRGIPTTALPNSNTTPVQTVLTQLGQHNSSASIMANSTAKGINLPIVNAMSEQLSVEIRRDHKIYKQEYKHGIPQTDLYIIGVTKETGTSITFVLDQELFRVGFDQQTTAEHIAQLSINYPDVKFQMI